MLNGACSCGAVRFEAGGVPFHATCCHCTQCRGSTGAPFVAWFSVNRADFRFTHGSPTRFRSSARGTRSFCPQCGTQLTFESDDYPDEVDVTTSSLDDPAQVPPQDHTYVGSRLPWVVLADGLPQFLRARER
ncbi:GFA family protein [Eleftheria terrae]|uniref:GFA family protein n=1 Tax=Eleftheria terrae TaxID=1597781 RepID=UPI00263AE711|nr:GFA family protein [Eleftheria terrae]WKB51804.1 GFA family protein [Eleftheria terrae]